MAIIQMLNDIVHDVKESGTEVYGAISRSTHPVVELTAVDANGERKIWISISAISSFVG